MPRVPSTTTLTEVQVRRAQGIVQMPSAANDYELIVLITPYVVRNRDEARDVTEDFSERVEGFRRLRDAMRAKHRPHAPADAGGAEPAPIPVPAPPRRSDVAPPEGTP